jgi:H+/gluconate symporter-like permease
MADGGIMKKAELALPEIMLIAGTRVMAGAGAALLLADKLRKDERKTIGWTLFLIGAISTIPLMLDVLSKRK